jgi:Family of unknown function (DUF6056)
VTLSVAGDADASLLAPPDPGLGRLVRLAEVVFGLALALPLAAWALVGGYSRYTADDFCWAGILRAEGFLKANVHYYTIYSPRYTFTFLVNLAELSGPAIVPALPLTALLVWLASLTWTLAQFGMPWLRSLLLAEVAAVATLQTAPDLPQSFYWQTGLLTYLLPLVVATLLIGWLRLGIQHWWAWAATGVITFLAGGLSETYLIPQNVALTLALLVALACRTRRMHLVAALTGGVLALLVILAAPATAGRVQGTPADLWLTLSASVATAYFQVFRLGRFFPLTVLLCLVTPVLVLRVGSRIQLKWFALVTLAVLITLPFCYFPSFYAQNGNPPARALIVPGAMLIGYLLFAGYTLRGLLGVIEVPERGRAAALAVLALLPVIAAATTLPDQVSAARYAALFDAEEQQILASRDAGETNLIVPPLPPNLGEDFVTADRNNWFNQCVARYYDLTSIAIPG